MRAADDDPVDLLGRELRRLERGVPGLLTQRQVLGLAEALFPLLHVDVARCAPPVDELLGRRRRSDELGDHGRVLVVVAHEHRGGTVAAAGLVGTGGETAAQVGRHHEHGPAAVERGAQRPDAGTDRAAGVDGGSELVEAERGVNGGGVGLLEVRGVGGGEPQGVRLGPVRRAPQREPGGLDAHGGGVLVVGRHRARAPTAAAAEEGRDLGSVQASIRHVPTGADDPSHGFGV